MSAEIRPSHIRSTTRIHLLLSLSHMYRHECPCHVFTPVLRKNSHIEHILEFQETPGYVSEQKMLSCTMREI
jgi:hypothetical protein